MHICGCHRLPAFWPSLAAALVWASRRHRAGRIERAPGQPMTAGGRAEPCGRPMQASTAAAATFPPAAHLHASAPSGIPCAAAVQGVTSKASAEDLLLPTSARLPALLTAPNNLHLTAAASFVWRWRLPDARYL